MYFSYFEFVETRARFAASHQIQAESLCVMWLLSCLLSFSPDKLLKRAAMLTAIFSQLLTSLPEFYASQCAGS